LPRLRRRRAKGKRTSARDRHSGEGIFFTSKAVETYVLVANGLRWTVDNTLGDQAIGDASPEVGTRVRCEVLVNLTTTARTLRSVAGASGSVLSERRACRP
jgi:hypothetical protein